MRGAIIFALLVAASPVSAHEKLVRVPFVGCPADGQTGSVAAPKSGRTPALPISAAAKVAYYLSDEMPGVLAPRGWHCLQLYGSSGTFMLLTPERHVAKEFFSDRIITIRGPAIQRSVSYGGSSGRFEVAEQITRYFPSRMAFVHHVMALDGDILKDIPLRSKPYKTDRLHRLSANQINFTTPAGMEGEGTNSRLLPGKLPIDGLRKIVGPAAEPDLVGVEVRLPKDLRHLAPLILANAAQ